MTCPMCLSGRHVRCENRRDCSCLTCSGRDARSVIVGGRVASKPKKSAADTKPKGPRGANSWVTKPGFKRPDDWGKPGPKGPSATKLAEAREMHRNGASYREIGRAIGFSHSTVRKYLGMEEGSC